MGPLQVSFAPWLKPLVTPLPDVIQVLRYRGKSLKFTAQQQTFPKAQRINDVFTIAHQTSSCHIQVVMNNLKFIILDYLAAKKYGSWNDAGISATGP